MNTIIIIFLVLNLVFTLLLISRLSYINDTHKLLLNKILEKVHFVNVSDKDKKRIASLEQMLFRARNELKQLKTK